MDGTIWLWIGFNLFVLALLAIDLGIFHRKSHAVSVKEAAIWSVVWISLYATFQSGELFLLANDFPHKLVHEQRSRAGFPRRVSD